MFSLSVDHDDFHFFPFLYVFFTMTLYIIYLLQLFIKQMFSEHADVLLIQNLVKKVKTEFCIITIQYKYKKTHTSN